MGRYSNVKVVTFSKDISVNELGPEFQLFDTKVMQSDGNNLTLVGYEYYRPSYRTCFRRPGRNKNNRNQLQCPSTSSKEKTSDVLNR